MSREERFICAPCAAYYEKVGEKFVCPKCSQERIQCADCAIAHSLHPKGGPIMITGGNVINMLEPFVFCQKIKYYKTYSEANKCKDFVQQYWNTTGVDV